MPGALLSVRDLRVQYALTRGAVLRRDAGAIHAVDGVSFDLDEGETLGLVGESGSGKSSLGRAVLQLIQPTSGSVRFAGEELTALWKGRGARARWRPELRALRRRMQMIFQDSSSSLDPRMTVEEIVAEPLVAFRLARGAELSGQVAALLERVGMGARSARRYPHELSGGQRQRVGIARALALEPDLVVADEPISALDVSTQAQILNLIADLERDLGSSFLLISHDLRAVQVLSKRVAVMLLGRFVELGPVDSVASRPAHPYTRALLAAIPSLDPAQADRARVERARQRVSARAEAPSALEPAQGCVHRLRCPERADRCAVEAPALREIAPGHLAACHVVERSEPAA